MVRPEQYEESRDALRQMKDQIIETFAEDENSKGAWQDSWPFDG